MKQWRSTRWIASLALVMTLAFGFSSPASALGTNLFGYSDRALYIARAFGLAPCIQTTVAVTTAGGASSVLVAAQGAGTKILVTDVRQGGTTIATVTGPLQIMYRSGTTNKMPSKAFDEADNSAPQDQGRDCNILCADNETFNVLNLHATAALAHTFFVTYIVLDGTVH